MTDLSTIRLTDPTIPRHASHVAERLVGDELVLFDAKCQRVHALNPTAAFVWLSCDGDHDEQQIVAALAERFPDDKAAIEEDVASTLRLFAAEGLIERGLQRR
jgi:hypothetical protein